MSNSNNIEITDIEVNKKSKLKKFLKIFLIIIFVLTIIILYGRFIGTKGLIVKEYKIVNENFVDNFYGLKIIHISDIHYGDTTNQKDLEKIVDKINFIKPDIVFFTGDLYSNHLTDEKKNELISTLKTINASIKKYAIIGNHEDENWDDIIKKINFINLNNDYDLIYNNHNSSILIAGINTNDEINESTKKINEFLDNTEDNIIYKILLLHEPDKILDFDYNKYDLILAGHSHNGQIRLPFIGAIYTPEGAKKYYDEYYELNNTKLYISSGIGTSTLKLRLFNRPSFNFYRLSNK